MTPRLVSAEHRGGYVLLLTFADETSGLVDFRDELWGPVFEPLRDPAMFSRFRLNRELNTIEWPTGADFAPEFLYERVRRKQSAA